MHKNNPVIQTLIPVALGAFAVLGFAPFYIFPASIFALTGLFYLWIKSESPKNSFKLGFLFGLGLYIVGIYWIYISLHDYGNMPWWFAAFCTFVLCAFMALFPALVGYFSKRLGWLLMTAPLLWGISDWVRSWIFTGFPWLTLGYSQVPYSPLSGYIPVFGVYGVSVLTALSSMLVALIAVNKIQKNGQPQRSIILAFVLIFILGAGLKLIPWSQPFGQKISVDLVQGNISQDIKWSPEHANNTIKQYLEMVSQASAQLIVLPETAMPVIASELDPAVTAAIKAQAIKNKGNAIVGMVEYNEGSTTNIASGNTSADYFNSALSFGEAETQVYRKNHLVPFGEFIPLKQVFGWIYRDWLNMPLSDISRGGTTQQPMKLGDQLVAVNICYEDVFGEEIIRQLPAATLLVNISNDAWYGKSYAAEQHMQFSQARALETGRMVLRATNTGATAAIDTHGYVIAHAAHDTQTTLSIVAQGFTGTTPYVFWGNWPFIAFSFIAIAFVWYRKNK